MRSNSLYLILLTIFCFVQIASSQPESIVRRQAQGKVVGNDELVSFKSDVPYSKAMQGLGELSKKLEGKLVIDRSPMQGKDKAIGINIESMYWKDALELILRSNQLWYNDYPEYMEIVSFEEVGKQVAEPSQKGGAVRGQPDAGAAMRSTLADSSEFYSQIHEIMISSVFFDVNKTKLAESGMDFTVTRGSDLNLSISLQGQSSMSSPGFFGASVNPTGLPVSINAGLSAMEKDQLGEIIARPQMIVRPGATSIFQVGADFSVLERDFSGNTVQKFYPTGTILNVRPRIFKVGDMEFVDIFYRIEKSTFIAGGSGSSVINKTTATGSLLLLNGEEGFIGGMYSNDETIVRQGIPILKDLPWWFFGLRYLFGFNSSQVVKRELVVLLKAEILPSVEERGMKPQTTKNIIKESQEEMQKDIKRRLDK